MSLTRAGFEDAEIVLDDYAEQLRYNSIIVTSATKSPMSVIGEIQEETKDSSDSDRMLWLVRIPQVTYFSMLNTAVLQVSRSEKHPIMHEIKRQCSARGITARHLPLTDVARQLPKDSRLIMLAEIEASLFSRMINDEFKAVKHIFSEASSCIWVTTGELLSGRRPEQSLVSGLSKCIMKGRPSFHLSTIDIDIKTQNYSDSASLIIQHELELRNKPKNDLDTVLIENQGVTYISRYIPDHAENIRFNRRDKPHPEILPIQPGLFMDFMHVGQIESYYFREKPTKENTAQANEVLIESRAFSISKPVRLF
jgi:hypothetical protein